MVGFLKKLTGKGENFYLEIKDDDAQPSVPLTPKAKASEPAATPATPAPEPAAPAPEPATAPAAPAPTVKEPEPSPITPTAAPQPDVTFAPDYLLSLKTFSTRRPGPSMAKFMGLAQQMKR